MNKKPSKAVQEKPVESLQDFFFPNEGRTIKAGSLEEAQEILNKQSKQTADDSAEA